MKYFLKNSSTTSKTKSNVHVCKEKYSCIPFLVWFFLPATPGRSLVLGLDMSGHAYPVNIHRASDLSVWLLCALITDKEHTHTHTGACTDAMTGGVCKCSMCMWDSGAWVHECSCPCSHVEIRVQGPLWRCVHVHRQAHMHWPAVSTLWCLHFFHSTNHSCISLSHHSPAQLSPFHLL